MTTKTADIPDTLDVEFPIEQALNGKRPEESNLDDEAIETFVAMTKDIEVSKTLRELAEDPVDEDDLPKAERLLWIDQAEVYSLCAGCYHENSDGAWTGSTSNPHYADLREQKQQALEEGRPCTFCRDEREKSIKEDLAEEIDVEVTVRR
jgi:hypothetical protein